MITEPGEGNIHLRIDRLHRKVDKVQQDLDTMRGHFYELMDTLLRQGVRYQKRIEALENGKHRLDSD